MQSGKQQAAQAAFQLGELANNRIDYAKAYEHYSDAARLQPDNPVYLNLAGLLARNLGSYSDAQPFFEKTLKIREKALGPEHRDTAASLNNLAALYQTTGAYAKAEPLYRHALAIQEKALGPDNPEVAASLTNLASLYVNQGRYADAEPLLRRSLVILEEVVGHWSPATSVVLHI